MPKSKITAIIDSDIENVWRIVTSLDNYTWRSDISRIDVLESGKTFIEYTADNYPTTFTIMEFRPFNRYEFKMDNSNMSGYWVGVFESVGNGTKIDFTEDITAKKFYLRPFVKIYLKKQQAKYIYDLKFALGNNA